MELQEFVGVYMALFNEKWRNVTCPVMTRWYTVGLAADKVWKEWDRMIVLAKKIRQSYSAESTPNKCASALTSLLAEPALKTHVAFIKGYHEAWWNWHFYGCSRWTTSQKCPASGLITWLFGSS